MAELNTPSKVNAFVSKLTSPSGTDPVNTPMMPILLIDVPFLSSSTPPFFTFSKALRPSDCTLYTKMCLKFSTAAHGGTLFAAKMLQ
jgi:hypothetical protein